MELKKGILLVNNLRELNLLCSKDIIVDDDQLLIIIDRDSTKAMKSAETRVEAICNSILKKFSLKKIILLMEFIYNAGHQYYVVKVAFKSNEEGA